MLIIGQLQETPEEYHRLKFSNVSLSCILTTKGRLDIGAGAIPWLPSAKRLLNYPKQKKGAKHVRSYADKTRTSLSSVF